MFLHLLCLIHLDWLGSVFPVGPIGGGIKQLPRNCSKNLKSCANIVCLLCKIDNLIKSSYCNYITAKGYCITISRTLLYYYKLRRMGVLAPQYSKLRPAFLYRLTIQFLAVVGFSFFIKNKPWCGNQINKTVYIAYCTSVYPNLYLPGLPISHWWGVIRLEHN